MVFCYKSAVTSPRKSRSVSPNRKRTYSGRCSPQRPYDLDLRSSEYLGSGTDRLMRMPSLGSLPKRDLKILEAMARKREDEIVRQNLAEKFNELWSQEKEARKKMDTEAASRYHRFLEDKRSWDREWSEQRQLQREIERHLERGRLARDIQDKDERTAHMLELLEDEKLSAMWSRRLLDEARYERVARRRTILTEAEDRRKRLDAAEKQSRADAARQRRSAILRDASQRTAITNSISQVESARLQREAAVADLLRHEHLRTTISAKEARMEMLVRAKRDALWRSRRTARLTAELREMLR